jgi:lysozyme
MKRVGKKGLELIKSFESFVPYVYDDLLPPVKGKYREWDGGAVKGTLTIGYGHTDAAKHELKIQKGLRISESKALAILDVDLDECEAAVNKLVTVKLTQGQFDALTSFAFNCGTGNLKKLIAPLNRGDYDACRRKFDEFTRSKGQVLRGLVRRRDAEQALWDDRYDEIALPEAPVEHPAEVDPPKPPPKETISEGAAVGGGFSLVGVLLAVWEKLTTAPTNIQDAVIAAASKPVFWCAVVAAVACAYVWYRRRRMRVA